jgi:hypothetical protein
MIRIGHSRGTNVSVKGAPHFHNFAFSSRLNYHYGMSGIRRMPMRIIKRYDAAEILMLAAGVLLVVAVAFVF